MAAKKSSDIPSDVIDQFLKDIAVFTPDSGVSLDVSDLATPPTVKIVAPEVQVFAAPKASAKHLEIVTAGARYPFIGRHKGFVGFVHNDKPAWTRARDVEMPDVPGTIFEGSAGAPPTIKLAKGKIPVFPLPEAKTKRSEIQIGSTELPFIGIYKDFVCVEHDNKPLWTSTTNVDMSAFLKTGFKWWGWGTTGGAAKDVTSPGLWAEIRVALVRRACDLRNQYQNNPYITIKGFTIEFGLSPSLSIDFEFKN